MEAVDLNKEKIRELLGHNNIKIKYINIFPNPAYSNCNTCIIFFEKNNIDYLLYAEKVKNTVEISTSEFYDALYTQRTYELITQILPEKDIVFRVIQLTSPKEITMKDIEEKFGGPVKIVE